MQMGRGMAKRILSLFRNLFCQRAVEQALEEELRSSVEILTQEKMQQGLSRSAARREALLELGGIEQVKEEVRAARSGRNLRDLGRDFRFAYRTLARSPGFTMAAVMTLAVGIGVNATVFSIVNGLLFRGIPAPHPSGLVSFGFSFNGSPVNPASYLDFQDMRQQAGGLVDLFGR